MVKVTRKELKNGLRIIHHHMPWLESVSMSYFVRAGSIDEKKVEYGISHFLEHMLFNGSLNYPGRQEAAKEAEKLGIYQNAWTYNDVTNYEVSSVSEVAPRAFEFLHERVSHPLLDEDAIEMEKGIILEEVMWGENDPYRKNWRMFARDFYRGTALAHEVIGTKESISNFDRKLIEGYMRRYYNPSNMILAVAGNVEAQDFFDLVSKAYGDEERVEPVLRKDVLSLDRARGSVQFGETKHMRQSVAYVGFDAKGWISSQKYPLALLSSMLSSGKACILEEEFKINEPLVSSIGSEGVIFKNVGGLLFEFEYNHKDTDKIISKLVKLFDEIKSGKVNRQEFERAKNLVLASYKYMFESSQLFIDINSFAHRELVSGIRFNPEEEIGKYKKVEFEDMVKVANEVINLDKAVISIVGPKEKAKEGWEELVG